MVVPLHQALFCLFRNEITIFFIQGMQRQGVPVPRVCVAPTPTLMTNFGKTYLRGQAVASREWTAATLDRVVVSRAYWMPHHRTHRQCPIPRCRSSLCEYHLHRTQMLLWLTRGTHCVSFFIFHNCQPHISLVPSVSLKVPRQSRI